MKGWVYILRCADETYYTGSTNNIILRIHQHNNAIGAIYTAKRLPLELVYLQEYSIVSEAFYREKQIQGWSRRKKEALMKSEYEALHLFSACYKEFENALLGKNKRFQKYDLESIKGIKPYLNEGIIISEVLDSLLSKK
jgi:putative endonuclease